MSQHVVLPIFEGPLDLLLFLITRAQIDINDIFISNITEQYLEYTAQISMDNMENKSLFLIMAARLLEIKSQKLLPKPIYEDEDEEGAESKLIRQLQEYKLYKMACEKLKENEDEAKKRFYRLPEEIVPRTELDLEGVGIEALTQAFAILLKKFNEVEEEIPPREIERETFTVQEKMFLIRKKLLKSKRTSFTDLFTESSTKSEVIVTFMALLELSKLGRIIITQKNKKDTIFIESVVTEGKDNE